MSHQMYWCNVALAQTEAKKQNSVLLLYGQCRIPYAWISALSAQRSFFISNIHATPTYKRVWFCVASYHILLNTPEWGEGERCSAPRRDVRPHFKATKCVRILTTPKGNKRDAEELHHGRRITASHWQLLIKFGLKQRQKHFLAYTEF
jgi:hypothetical protein